MAFACHGTEFQFDCTGDCVGPSWNTFMVQIEYHAPGALLQHKTVESEIFLHAHQVRSSEYVLWAIKTVNEFRHA